MESSTKDKKYKSRKSSKSSYGDLSDDNVSKTSSKKSFKIKRFTSKSSSLKTPKKKDKFPGLQRSHSLEPISGSNQKIEMLTPKQNGYVEEDAGGGGEEAENKEKRASIKGMWKKAFKSLKSNDKQTWLSKKGSLIKRKEEEIEEEAQESSKEIDPVYSLLKCAADLPKVPAKSQKEAGSAPVASATCSGHLGMRGDSSGSTSKASSPSSSGLPRL